MCCLRWGGRHLALHNMPISGVNSTPRPTAVYASDPALPRRPQDSLPSCLLGFGRTRLSLASSFQLSYRTPHPALGQDFTLSRATPSAASEHLLELIGFPISEVLHHVLRLDIVGRDQACDPHLRLQNPEAPEILKVAASKSQRRNGQAVRAPPRHIQNM